MNISKNLKWIIILIIICCCAVVLGIGCPTKISFAYSEVQENNISNIGIFSDRPIEESGYLYNYDDSADYLYADFADNMGYAIFANETMEVLEYSLEGDFPYDTHKNTKRYYGGPNMYFFKSNDKFVSFKNNALLGYEDVEMQNQAQKIRNMFSLKKKFINEEESENLILNRINKTIRPQSPPLDENNWISPTNGATYIRNSEYFMTKSAPPAHGSNNGTSCTSVATQLLLSYNNYYNDRRIIAPEHLFGGWNAMASDDVLDSKNYTTPSQNANVCENPSMISSKILGSNQEYHDYLFNNGVTGFLSDASKNLKPLLNLRDIDYTLFEKHTASNVSIGATDILNEINNGYPLVLTTSQTLNGTPYEGQRDFNHSVVAYGYQEFAPYQNDNTTYLGYIVHLGWDNYATGYRTNVWTNSSWYYSYMTLHINHDHKYNIILSENNEARCGECNHRRSIFSTNDLGNNNVEITGMNVPIDSDISIPGTIQGKTVTKIAPWAFANQNVIKYNNKITIPASVTIIGNNAFENNQMYDQVIFEEGSNLTEIGNSAFANSKLSIIELPSKLKKLTQAHFRIQRYIC